MFRALGLEQRSGVAAALLMHFLFCCGLEGQTQVTSAVATASAALRRGDADAAVQASSQGLKQTPHDIRLLTLRGMAYAQKKEPSLALESFSDALKVAPEYLPALEGAAQVAYDQGGDQARPYLRRILVRQPDDPTANGMTAVLDYRSHDCSGAVAHFEKARALLASQPGTLVQYGVCLAVQDRLGAAISVLQQAVDLQPANAFARYNLALAQWQTKRTADALTTLSPILTEQDISEDVLTLSAEMDEEQGNTQRAVELLRRAILQHPKEQAAYLQFAYLSYKHNSVDVGINMVNVGIKQIPSAAELYVARGVLVSQTKNATEALQDFEKAMTLDPHLSFAGAAEGIAKAQLHDPAAALATLRSAARQHPDDALTQYLLAEALSDKAPEPGSAEFAEELAAAKRSIAADTKRVEAHDLLASVYLRSGDVKLSLEQSEAALRLNPNDDQAVYHEILAMRKGENKAEVPALVQRLMAIRQTKAAEPKPKVDRLIESQATPE